MLVLALVSTKYVYKEYEQSRQTASIQEKIGDKLVLYFQMLKKLTQI